MLSKFAVDTKLGNVDNGPGCCAAFQRDLDRMEKWTVRYLLKVNKVICKVQNLGKKNTRPLQVLGTKPLESSSSVKYIVILVDITLNMSQKYAFVVKEANCILGFIRQVLPKGEGS